MSKNVIRTLEDEIAYLIERVGLVKVESPAVISGTPVREWCCRVDDNPIPGLLGDNWQPSSDDTYARCAFGSDRLILEWDGLVVTLTVEPELDRRKHRR